jgi:hypothetical protein
MPQLLRIMSLCSWGIAILRNAQCSLTPTMELVSDSSLGRDALDRPLLLTGRSGSRGGSGYMGQYRDQT